MLVVIADDGLAEERQQGGMERALLGPVVHEGRKAPPGLGPGAGQGWLARHPTRQRMAQQPANHVVDPQEPHSAGRAANAPVLSIHILGYFFFRLMYYIGGPR